MFDPLLQFQVGEEPVGVFREVSGDHLVAVDNEARVPLAHGGERLVPSCNHQIAADDQIGSARRNPGNVDFSRMIGEPQMAEDRSTFLGESNHVNDADALAFKVRGHAQQGTHGNHARAPYTRDDNVVRAVNFGELRNGQSVIGVGLGHGRLGFAQSPAVHAYKARAKPVGAGVVLVAGRLVNGALASQLGFKR